jgi:copper chaperone
MNSIQFKTNINCGSCIKSVTPFLNALDEVETWHVNTESPEKVLTVETDLSADDMAQEVIATVSAAGFKIERIKE